MRGEKIHHLTVLSYERREEYMTEKEYILKLMYLAFLDIRVASHAQDSRTCFILSDLFHTIPLQMNRAEKGEISYAEIATWIRTTCEERKCLSWLETATANMANLP